MYFNIYKQINKIVKFLLTADSESPKLPPTIDYTLLSDLIHILHYLNEKNLLKHFQSFYYTLQKLEEELQKIEFIYNGEDLTHYSSKLVDIGNSIQTYLNDIEAMV